MNDKQKKISQYDYEKVGAKFDMYIREADLLLRNDEYIVVHLDGVKFTSRKCKDLSATVKEVVFDSLVKTAVNLCDKFKGTRLAYVSGDEISVLLDGSCIKENYNNRVQKIISLFVSSASKTFWRLRGIFWKPTSPKQSTCAYRQ